MRIIASAIAASFGALTFHLGVLALGAPYAANATLVLDETRLALVRSGRIEVESLLARNVVLSFPDTQSAVRIRATGPSPDAAEAAAIAAGRVIALRLEQVDSETLRSRATMLREELMRAPTVTGSVPAAARIPGDGMGPDASRAQPGLAPSVREALAAARTPADLERIAGPLPASLAAAQAAHATALGEAESFAAIYGPRHPSLQQARRRAELAAAQLMQEVARVAAASPATMISAAEPQPASLPVVVAPAPERAPFAAIGLSEALETLVSAPPAPRGAVLEGAAGPTPIATARLAAIPAGAAVGLLAGMVLAGGGRPPRLRRPTGTWRSGSQPIQFETAEPIVEAAAAGSQPAPSPVSSPSPEPQPAPAPESSPAPAPVPALEPEADPYPIDALLDGFEPHDGATLIVEDEARPGSGDVLAVRLALRFVTAGRRVLIVDASAQGLIAKALGLSCDDAHLQVVRIPSRAGVCALLPLRDLVDRASNDWRCERAVQSLALLRGGYDVVVLRAPSLDALAAPVFSDVAAIFTVDEGGAARLIRSGGREAGLRREGAAGVEGVAS